MIGRGPARQALSAIALMCVGSVATLLVSALLPAAGREPRPAAPGAVDIGFTQDMIVHHQQAVTMAQTVRGRVGPATARLAIAIELNQTKQIGQLQGWLALWNAAQVPTGPPMTWMPGHRHPKGDGAMPGMASVQEINHLGDLTGKALDARFLQLMIRHHQGGLTMTTEATRTATTPQVRSLAALMTTEQQEENGTMTALLSALGHRPLP